jgi:hypothetical protein
MIPKYIKKLILKNIQKLTKNSNSIAMLNVPLDIFIEKRESY